MKDIAMKQVAVKDIVVGENFRKSMDKEALRDLTKSIEKVGIIEPLIVRQNGKDLVLIAGARRLAAAQELGLKEAPVRVVESTDDEARLMQAMENIHRENLNPIDEAEQFDKLLKENQQAKDLVDVVGKSLRYIYRSLALLELPKNVKDMIKTGKMKPAHGHLLLRVPEKRLPKVLEYYNAQSGMEGECSVNRLQREIDKMLGRDMTNAIFDKTECAKCPHYTKNQGLLFDHANEGLCDNADCYRKKTMEHRKMLAEQAGKGKAFKDLKFVGIRGGRYSYETQHYHVGPFVVVDEKIQKLPAYKKAFEKERDSFGYSLNPETNKPQLLIINEELIKKLELTKKEKGPERDYAQEEYINEAASAAVMTAYLKTDVRQEKLQKALVAAYIEDRVDEEIAAQVMGVKELKKADIAKLDAADLLKILCFDMVSDGDEDILKLLPDVNTAMKEAVKTAKAAWPEEKKRRDAEQAKKDQEAATKAVEARKAEKEQTPEEPQEEPTEEGGEDQE